jgi:putative membrane protein
MAPAASLTPVERERISAAIRAAEATTSGEIYVVVARSADDHRLVPILWAALVALPLPWPLHLLTDLSTTLILWLQAAAFVGLAFVLSHDAVRRLVVPAAMAAEATRRAAETLFLAHGVHLTEARTGVLIYVALAERRVEIVADAGINAKVDQVAWDKLAQDIVEAARIGRLVDGLVAAIEGAAAHLARHFPPAALNRNELPDQVVEL